MIIFHTRSLPIPLYSQPDNDGLVFPCPPRPRPPSCGQSVFFGHAVCRSNHVPAVSFVIGCELTYTWWLWSFVTTFCFPIFFIYLMLPSCSTNSDKFRATLAGGGTSKSRSTKLQVENFRLPTGKQGSYTCSPATSGICQKLTK